VVEKASGAAIQSTLVIRIEKILVSAIEKILVIAIEHIRVIAIQKTLVIAIEKILVIAIEEILVIENKKALQNGSESVRADKPKENGSDQYSGNHSLNIAEYAMGTL
jgi:hypothetical protein